MAKTTKAKSPKGGAIPEIPKYEFQIKEEDVVERIHFGSFEVIKTHGGIMFKNYSGFHIYTTPYAVGVDGTAATQSLYAWLDNLIETKKAFADKMDEPFSDATHDDGHAMTCGDILEADMIITEGNLLRPLTAFIDLDEAVKAANDHMAWLQEMQQKLLDSMNTPPASEEEAVKADAEEAAKAFAGETIGEMISEAVKENPELLKTNNPC